MDKDRKIEQLERDLERTRKIVDITAFYQKYSCICFETLFKSHFQYSNCRASDVSQGCILAPPAFPAEPRRGPRVGGSSPDNTLTAAPHTFDHTHYHFAALALRPYSCWGPGQPKLSHCLLCFVYI